MLTDIKKLVEKFIGPFFCGKDITLPDISMAPYFARMCVLEHYR